ncbi:MAG: EAL domain-containing protein [Rhodocyclaceae bacterium]|mgnify:CR=1 FL=1
MNAIPAQELGVLALPQNAAPANSLHPHEALDILLRQRFGVEYQPIVDTVSGDIAGFEALARFWQADGSPVVPDRMFGLLHDNPLLLFHAELEMKKLQIAAAPDAGMLFLNIDPDSYNAGNVRESNVFAELFAQHQRPGCELVIEVIENLHIGDVLFTRLMIDDLKAVGVKIAMDDLGTSSGLFSFDAMMDSAFIKFDRSWLANIPERRRLTILEWTQKMISQLGIKTVLEGVETRDDLLLAREMGFSFVQGFLYSKDFVRKRFA